MNDDLPSSSSLGPSAPSYEDAFTQPSSSRPARGTIDAIRKRNRQNFNLRRASLLEDLLTGLDLLVFTELGVLYYMDCSTLLLALRSALHFLHLTPKSATLLPTPPSSARFMVIILLVNVLCILLHALRSPPTSLNGQDRGYLHGGLVLDFIGQKGPSSRAVMVGLDLLVMGLQVVCCAGVGVRKRVREMVERGEAVDRPGAGRSSGQRVEDEERGVRRSMEVGVEMEVLNGAGRRQNTEEPENDAVTEERTDSRIFDAFNSGQIVLADLDLVTTLREELAGGNSEDEDGDEAATATVMRNRDMRRRLIERVRGRVSLRRSTADASARPEEV